MDFVSDRLPEWAKSKLAEAIKEPGVFEYGGYHFKPYRKFRKGELARHLKGDSRPQKNDMQYAMRNMQSDFDLAILNYGPGKIEWAYNIFYSASGGSDADIFMCVENGKLYVPGENELFRYTEPPLKAKQAAPKMSLLDGLEEAKVIVADQNAGRKDIAKAKKRDMEV